MDIYTKIEKQEKQPLNAAFRIFFTVMAAYATVAVLDKMGIYPIRNYIPDIAAATAAINCIIKLSKWERYKQSIQKADAVKGTVIRFTRLPWTVKKFKSMYELRTAKGEVINIFTNHTECLAPAGTEIYYVKTKDRYHFDISFSN